MEEGQQCPNVEDSLEKQLWKRLQGQWTHIIQIKNNYMALEYIKKSNFLYAELTAEHRQGVKQLPHGYKILLWIQPRIPPVIIPNMQQKLVPTNHNSTRNNTTQSIHHILFFHTTKIMASNSIHKIHKNKYKQYPNKPTFLLLMVQLPFQNTNKKWQKSSL